MAVFPDRIVLKNSTDDEATIISSIENGGTDAIATGEIVLGLEPGAASLYTLDSAGSVVDIFGGAIASATLDALSDVSVPSPSDLDVLAWDALNGEWISRPANPLNDISSNFLGDLGDVVIAAAAVDQVIRWDGSNWVNHTLTLDYSSDVILTTPADGEYLKYDGTDWVNSQIDYSEIQNVPAFLLSITSESIGDLSDVSITTATTGDSLVWSGSAWVNQAAPPANISANSIGDLGDVDTTGVSSGEVLIWSGSTWSPGAAPPADISSSSIGELSDVTYAGGDLTVSGVEGILLDPPLKPAAEQWSVRSAGIGIQLAAFNDLTGDGSYIISTKSFGSILRSSTQITTLQGTTLDGTDRPELRFSNGNNYVSFVTPAALSQDVALTLPDNDGNSGQVLSTDGTGLLYWASPSGLGSIGDIPDVDLDTTPPQDGYALRYQDSTAKWVSVPPSTGITLDDVTTEGSFTSNNISVGYQVLVQGDGSSVDGRIRLNSSQNLYAVTIQAPPSSDAASYSLILPSSAGTPGQVLTSQGGAQLTWEDVAASGGISNIVEDTTPQLGGNLDVNSFYISSASGGDIEIAPDTTGDFIVRGNNTDGSITLNCTANTHGVTIQSPPHADAATYTLVLPSTAGTAGQVLTSQGGAQLTWEDAGSGGATSIDELTDVDTSTAPPADGQALVWNSTDGEWQPGTVSGGGSGGSGAGIYLTETETSTGGEATFTGLGYSGILQKVTSTVDAWIVLYTSAAERTADAGRAFNTDPATGSGVLAEFYITAGTTVLATPGTTYLNNDTTLTEAIYAAVRTQAGAAVVSNVTISAYGLAAITAVSGGTFGSGV